MIDLIFYYVFYCSAVLLYGIGMNRETVLISSIDKNLFQFIIKCYIATLCSSALSWLAVMNLLVPANLIELYPLLALLIFIVIAVFIEMLMRITTGFKTSEFAVSYLIVLLALNESTSIIEVLVITASCMTAFVILLPVLFALQRRSIIAHPHDTKIDEKMPVMFAMAMILLCLAVWNVSWLSEGV